MFGSIEDLLFRSIPLCLFSLSCPSVYSWIPLRLSPSLTLTRVAYYGAPPHPSRFRFDYVRFDSIRFDLTKKQLLRVTILEAEGIRNVAVLKKTDSYVAAELVTTAGERDSRTSVKKVRGREGGPRCLDRDCVVLYCIVLLSSPFTAKMLILVWLHL